MRLLQTSSGLLLAALLAASAKVRADETPGVRADFDYASAYVFRGVERAGASAQAGVEGAHDDFHGGFWTNQPFARGAARDVTLTAGYAWRPAAGVTLEAVATQYLSAGGAADTTRRSTEGGLTLTGAAFAGCTPSIYYGHDFRLRSDTVQLSVGRSLALTALGTFLDFNLFAGAATGSDWQPDAGGPRRADSYAYWGAEVHVPYRIGAHSTVVGGLHFTDATGRSPTNGPFGLAAERKLWVTLGVSLDF